jgi:hypothetical protein
MYKLQEVYDTLQKSGFVVYKEPNRLNLVGIRSSNPSSLTFDDFLVFFYFDNKGNINGRVCPATTDPSVSWLNTPMNTSGAAILKSGQYIDAYKIGLHKGKYQAIVQCKPVTVIRDNDRDSILNFFAKTETGIFGINIHKPTAKNDTSLIGLDSAGCQVFKNIGDFDEMMRLAAISKDLYGNSFTYTLIDEFDTVKKQRNYLSIGIAFIAIGVYGYWAYKKLQIK